MQCEVELRPQITCSSTSCRSMAASSAASSSSTAVTAAATLPVAKIREADVLDNASATFSQVVFQIFRILSEQPWVLWSWHHSSRDPWNSIWGSGILQNPEKFRANVEELMQNLPRRIREIRPNCARRNCAEFWQKEVRRYEKLNAESKMIER